LKELREKIISDMVKKMQLSPLTLDGYARYIIIFSDYSKIKPYDFKELGIEKIEALTEAFIFQNLKQYAPKSLNVAFNAVKAWCYVLGMIKNRKMFKELKFDTHSRKTDAMTERPLETEHFKAMMQICDIHEKVLVGLYGLCGIRPSIIPQLKVGDFHHSDYTLQDGRIHFTTETPFLFVNRAYEGNKAKITFFVIVPSKITELLELALNGNGQVTPETPLLSKYRKRKLIFRKVKLIYKRIGFDGRPYLLRTYADRVLDKNIMDEDLKEFMLGHKGKISSVYQFKQLTTEDRKAYTKQYEVCDKWINENVFGVPTNKEVSQADAIARIAVGMGVNADIIAKLKEAFNTGKLEMPQFEKKIIDATNTTLNQRMKTQFEEMFIKMNKKHNNKQ